MESRELRLIRLLKRDLATEASIWVERELISVDQARSICRLYGIDYDEVRDRSTAYRILVGLAFLFVGLSLITVIGANWEAIPRGVRLAGMIALTAGTHALALRQYLSLAKSRGTGLFLLGNLFYGASIILIAQVYHLGEHMPDGVFWWALGSLPFAVLLCSSWLTLLSGVLALIWFCLEYAMGLFAPWFPVFLAAEVYVLVRGRRSVALFLLCAASLFVWIEASLSLLWTQRWLRLEFFSEHFFVSVALFILAWAAAHWLHSRSDERAKDYGAVLALWTLRFALIGMFVLSYERPWVGLIASDWSGRGPMWATVTTLMAIALWIGSRTATLRPLLVFCVLCGGTMVAVVLTENEAGAIWFQVLDNVALVAAGIWLIVRGTLGGVSHYFFLGVAVILLTAFMRYVDLIGDYVGGALLFMLLAALLLGAARYWKSRQDTEIRA